MIAPEIVAQRKQAKVDHHPPQATMVSMPRLVVSSLCAESGNSQQSRADGTTTPTWPQRLRGDKPRIT